MTYNYIKPLVIMFATAVVAGCATTKYTDAVERDGCWEQTQRTWTKGKKTVGVETVTSKFDETCGQTQLQKIKHETAQEILIRRAVNLKEDAVKKIFETIAPNNKGVTQNLNAQGVTIKDLLSREVDGLFSVAFDDPSSTPSDKNKALGDIVSIHAGRLYPLHTKTGVELINAQLDVRNITIDDVKDQYLGKQDQPSLECATQGNVLRCFTR